MQANWMDIPGLKRKHKYYVRTGFYGFLIKNIIKILFITVALIGLFFILQKWVIDMDVVFKSFFKNTPFHLVFIIFFISESVFGLIPPDFFIIWGGKFEHPWLIVSALAIISYLGGILSYKIGYKVREIKKLNAYLNQKFADHFKKIKRWGAFFLMVAALFPLPYSTICIISGILKYPFKNFIFIGFVRILRFYIYALVLFGLIQF